MSEEDLQKNKAIIESLTKGGCAISIDCNGEVSNLILKVCLVIYMEVIHFFFIFKPVRRESLLPPIPTMCTWKEYFTSPAGQHPTLAREMVFKNTTRGFKATVAMVL